MDPAQQAGAAVQPSSWLGAWFQQHVERLSSRFLGSVDVRLNGDRPFDLQARRPAFHVHLAKYVLGLDRLALGDSYVRGDWDTQDLFGLLARCCESPALFAQGFHLIARLMHSAPLLYLNRQSRALARQAIAAHYDIGNDLFEAMLDPTLNYSCGYWLTTAETVCWTQLRRKEVDQPTLDGPQLSSASDTADEQRLVNLPLEQQMIERPPAAGQRMRMAENLHQAQLNKMLLIGRKLKLRPGMQVLDIGCGWGSLAKFLALHFGVHVLAVTISKEQIEFALQHQQDYAGLCCDARSAEPCGCAVGRTLQGRRSHWARLCAED